jgi:hypothetical protein
MFTEEINAPAGSYNSLTHQVAYCKMQGECVWGGREGGKEEGETYGGWGRSVSS